MTNLNPWVEAITLPNYGVHGGAEQLIFSLNFNDNVFVGQVTPQLPVEIGYRMRHAEYLGGSGTNVLDFALRAPRKIAVNQISARGGA